MPSSFFPLTVAAGYGILVALLLHYREQRDDRMGLWLGVFLGVSAVVGIVSAILRSTLEYEWLGSVAMYGWAITLVALVFLTLEYGGWDWRRPVAIGAVVWLSLVLMADWLTANAGTVFNESYDDLLYFPRLDVGGVFFLGSWLVIATGLIVASLYGSARAQLPLHANRLLYWAATLVLVFVGQLLFACDPSALSITGAIIGLLGAGGLVYGVVSYHLFDVRGLVRRVLVFILLTALTTMLMVGATLATIMVWERNSLKEAVPLAIMFALLLAVIYQLGRPGVERFINRLVESEEYDPAEIVENYARSIGNILEIGTLATVVVDTINGVLDVRRGCVMLVTQEDGQALVQPVGGRGYVPVSTITFPRTGPFFSYFVQGRRPLLQYHIDVLPEFRSLSSKQREWLATLQMGVYVPIMTQGLPIGLLAVGPKVSGTPYRSNELKLLQTLAGQTVVALNNARLFDDMKRLNAEIQLLNEDLRFSNERLQNMDSVKTDFITIASHELRTPLTQVKGYTDIMDAMIEDGSLTQDDGRQLVGRIGRATEQLEKVIGAMLDVSQIDVDAMSLNLGETKLDAVLRIAVEPLVHAIRQRRLTLTVRGIRNLPPIVADFQRLVQVVSNLVYNAVKYTPDGGRISISAEVLQDETGDDKEIELVFADTGVGIDPRDHDLIFEKFFRTYDPQLHSTGSTKFLGAGPGLGLSIARGIVEAHGGRIWVESDGHDPKHCPGSKFHVILPLEASLPAQVLLESHSSEIRL